MAQRVMQQKQPSTTTTSTPIINEFGADIVVAPPVTKKVSKERQRLMPGMPGFHPWKVKPKKLREYVLTELAKLDENWLELNFHFEALGQGADMDVDDEEEELEKWLTYFEGKIDGLFELGKMFGLSEKDMLKVIDNFASGFDPGKYDETKLKTIQGY